MTDAPGTADRTRAAPRVSVICPFYNETRIIEAATAKMAGLLDETFGEDYELILVNDGSRDDSLDRLLGMLEETHLARVRVLTYPANQGRGRALKTGIDAARGDILATTELDCSWGDDVVPRLVAELDAHPESHFVVASPHMPGGGLARVPASRVFLSRVGNRLIRIFFTHRVTMNTGMTRAYRRAVVQPLVTSEDGKEFHLEVLLKLLALGFRVREIPATITWQDHALARRAAPERRSSTRIFETIVSHLKFVVIAQPVRYFGILAVLTFLVGTGFMLSAVVNLLTGGPAVFVAIIGLIVLLLALVLGGLSVLFFQLREIARESWMHDYATPLPPYAPAPAQVYPRVPARRVADSRGGLDRAEALE